MSFSDLVGGRVLAWTGGAATLIGIVLFLVLAISHGWIGEEARVGLAGTASFALMAAGIWLHNQRGRTEASMAMVGTAVAGFYSTLIVASQIYALIPSGLAVAASMLVGALATVLAIRWAGRAIGALGLIGGLLSPVLVGVPPSAATMAVLAVASACAMWVVIQQRWAWLGLASVLVCAPQWASWVLAGQAPVVDVIVLSVFGSLGLMGAAATQGRSSDDRLHPASAALAALSACLVAVIGRAALDGTSGNLAAQAWLVALAGAHTIVGVRRLRWLQISAPLRRMLIAIGVVLADVAFGFTASGIALAVGWGATATAFAWALRQTDSRSVDEKLVGVGLGAHVALTLIRTLIDAPPSTLGAAGARLPAMLSVSVLAASCLGAAQLIGHGRERWQAALNALGVGSIAYLTAAALSGPALVCAWGLQALILIQIGKVTHDATARYGTFWFLGLAVLHAVLVEAPPLSLIAGVSSLDSAAVALGAIALVTFRAAQTQSRDGIVRRSLFGASAGTLLYLASVAIVSAFQPIAGTSADTVLDLGVRQQGQVLLSALWGLVGLAALIIGLRAKDGTVRSVALGWLMITVGKVFLYDLATLTSIYRVVTFIVLGLLLLAGAFAYQRLRPPPLPDMRTVRPAQM
ncbi:MAG: DUF2339 domain-containing protein [Solirubrobacteraceae bacterium]